MSVAPQKNCENAVQSVQHAPPRTAYIHVPFCRHRCGYCNFTLVAGRDDLIADYLRTIELELQSLNMPREVDTLYFGGGTPTHLSPQQFRQLAEIALRWFPLSSYSRSLEGRGEGRAPSPFAEWSVEANPADINSTMIDTLAHLGVTRMSLGAQSVQPGKLRVLERDHSAADVEHSVRFAKNAGMQISLDLIFATPGETHSQWQSDLDAVIDLAPDHISTYGLTYEPGTEYWARKTRGEFVEADEELQRDMYAAAIDRLTAAGYEHYEVSNFALPGRRSRHNQVYWSGDGYYAAGPGAARYVNGVRETNQRSTLGYLKNILAGESPVAEREQLSPEARAREHLVFGLRRIEGIARLDFRQRSGFDIDQLAGNEIKKFVALNLLRDNGDIIKLTREGLFVSDAIWPEML